LDFFRIKSIGPGWIVRPAFLSKMLIQFEEKVADFIRDNDLVSADRILLAVSGGADSTALLYAVRAVRDEGIFEPQIVCAHINHQLRGQAARSDAEFVVGQAAKLGFGLQTQHVDVKGYAAENKLSIETAARKLRIDSLLAIAKKTGCEFIFTAHHSDDNAETVLQRLARGTGFRGLCGIWPIRWFGEGICFVRPLLAVARAEIIDYLKRRSLSWCTDESNYDCRYRRNYIRHKLIPYLQERTGGSVTGRLADLSEAARKFNIVVCRRADELQGSVVECIGNKITLDCKAVLPELPDVTVELIRRALIALGSGQRDLTQRHFESVIGLAEQGKSGRRVELPDGFTAVYEYGNLIFAKVEANLQTEGKIDKSIEIKIPGKTEFGDFLIEASVLNAGEENIKKFSRDKDEFVEWFDLSRLKQPVVARFRLSGDRFTPLGLSDEKKVGRFLTDAKVSGRVREKLLIVTDEEKIIWVCPVRISEDVKVSADTKKILQLKIRQAEAAKV